MISPLATTGYPRRHQYYWSPDPVPEPETLAPNYLVSQDPFGVVTDTEVPPSSTVNVVQRLAVSTWGFPQGKGWVNGPPSPRVFIQAACVGDRLSSQTTIDVIPADPAARPGLSEAHAIEVHPQAPGGVLDEFLAPAWGYFRVTTAITNSAGGGDPIPARVRAAAWAAPDWVAQSKRCGCG